MGISSEKLQGSKCPDGEAEYTVDLFMQGYSCSECIVLAFADRFGLDPDTAARISSGFGFMAGKNREKTCGVVTGAIMVIGLRFGAGLERNAYATDLCALVTQEFITRFAERRGSMNCYKIHATYKDSDRIRELVGKYASCAKVTRDAAEILEEILNGEFA